MHAIMLAAGQEMRLGDGDGRKGRSGLQHRHTQLGFRLRGECKAGCHAEEREVVLEILGHKGCRDRGASGRGRQTDAKTITN
jgi:hypothetical protein